MKELLNEIENIEKVADLKTKVLLQMLKAKVIKMIVEEETLIQEERKEAVEGFAKYLERRNKDWFCGLLEGIYLLRAKRYLQSLESEGK